MLAPAGSLRNLSSHATGYSAHGRRATPPPRTPDTARPPQARPGHTRTGRTRPAASERPPAPAPTTSPSPAPPRPPPPSTAETHARRLPRCTEETTPATTP